MKKLGKRFAFLLALVMALSVFAPVGVLGENLGGGMSPILAG